MTLDANKRRWLLGLALALTVLATVMAPKSDDDTVVAAVAQPVGHADTSAAPTSQTVSANSSVTPDATPEGDNGLQVLPLLPRKATPTATLFVTPPQPKAAVAVYVPPSAPQEPPLPSYSVVGHYNNGSNEMVLLASGKDTLEVQAGDNVDNGWQVKTIDDNNIVFVSPSGKQQLLSIDDGQ